MQPGLPGRIYAASVFECMTQLQYEDGFKKSKHVATLKNRQLFLIIYSCLTGFKRRTMGTEGGEDTNEKVDTFGRTHDELRPPFESYTYYPQLSRILIATRTTHSCHGS
jgi:hypothetical protein